MSEITRGRCFVFCLTHKNVALSLLNKSSLLQAPIVYNIIIDVFGHKIISHIESPLSSV